MQRVQFAPFAGGFHAAADGTIYHDETGLRLDDSPELPLTVYYRQFIAAGGLVTPPPQSDGD